MYKCYYKSVLLIGAVLLPIVGISRGSTLTNGDFETGDLSGWTVFTTANGTNGASCPVVEPLTLFPLTPNPVKFRIGSTISGQRGGGGIYQDVMVDTAGTYELGAAFMFSTIGLPNGMYRPGLFELLVDEQLVASHDYGEKSGSLIYRYDKGGSIYLDPGLHEVVIRITRTELTGSNAPWQFVDNVTMVPEPATIGLLALGSLTFIRRRRICQEEKNRTYPKTSIFGLM